MKERGILFSAPMIRALLAGTKTQTRRAVKNIPAHAPIENDPDALVPLCPYGVRGDRLWVRETWCHQYVEGDAIYEGHAPALPLPKHPYVYRADSEEVYGINGQGHAIVDGKGRFKTTWIPSIHMPRVASRITLEVTEVRVERLRDISWQDCRDEGVGDPAGVGDDETWQDAYFALWDSINGAGAAAKDPWVWALSFRRLP